MDLLEMAKIGVSTNVVDLTYRLVFVEQRMVLDGIPLPISLPDKNVIPWTKLLKSLSSICFYNIALALDFVEAAKATR